jgi:hypothetical protein
MSTRTEDIPTTEQLRALAGIRSQLQEALILLYGTQAQGHYAAPSITTVLDNSIASLDSTSSALDGRKTTFSRNALSKKPVGKRQKLEKVETSLFGDASNPGLFDKLRSLNK